MTHAEAIQAIRNRITFKETLIKLTADEIGELQKEVEYIKETVNAEIDAFHDKTVKEQQAGYQKREETDRPPGQYEKASSIYDR